MIYLLSVLFLFNNLNSQIVMDNSIHQFVVNNINGDSFDFSTLKGKKIMIVNTASKCGLTPQYKKLQSKQSEHYSRISELERQIKKETFESAA